MALIDKNDTPGKSAARIAKLLEDIDIAMLTTVGAKGDLVSRPLSTQDASFDGRRVWFFTEADSPKVAEIRREPRVNVAYASKDKNTYVSVAGRAKLSKDRAKIDALWSDALKAFFPKGKDDPNLVLLQVDVRSVEYWDGPGSLLGKLVTFVVARVTRKEEVMAENRIIDMTGARTTSRLPPSNKAARPAPKPAAKKAVKKAVGKATGKAVKKTAATAPRKASVTRNATRRR
jgi:general stress protein 26